MSRPSARRAGFTLVELLVVIAVIGILATITFGLFKAANIGRNKSKSKGEIQAISMAAQSYRKAYGEFPCCATGTDDRFRRDLLDQLLGRRLDLLVVELADLVEHRVEGAGVLTDCEHIHDHGREHGVLLQRPSERLALAHRLLHVGHRPCDHDIAGGVGDGTGI